MGKIIIFLFVVLLQVTATFEINPLKKFSLLESQTQPSLKVRANIQFLNWLKNNLIDKYLNQLVRSIPPINLDAHGFCDVEIRNFVFPSYSVDVANSFLTGQQGGKFQIHLQGLSIVGKGHVKVFKEASVTIFGKKISKTIFKASDDVEIKVNIPSVDVQFHFSADQNQQIIGQIDSISMNVKVDYIRLGSWMSEIVDFVRNIFQSQFNDLFRNAITDALRSELQQLFPYFLNNQVVLLSQQYQIMLESKFTTFPTIEDNSIVLESFLTTYLQQNKQILPNQESTLPSFAASSKQMEIMIGQYFLNSISSTVFQTNILNFQITPEMVKNQVDLNISLFGDLYPELQQKYGEDQPIEILLRAIKEPRVSIMSNQIASNLTAEIMFQINKNNSIDSIFSIQCELLLQANAIQRENILNFELSGLQILSLHPVSGQVDPSVILESMNETFISGILSSQLPTINNQFFKNKGINLNFIIGDLYVITDPELTLHDSYLMISANLSPKQN